MAVTASDHGSAITPPPPVGDLGGIIHHYSMAKVGVQTAFRITSRTRKVPLVIKLGYYSPA